MSASAVRLVGLTRTYAGQSRPALNALSLDVAPGEFLVLVGPSGCGKSTALRSIAGLEEPDEGQVWIGDRDVTGLAAARARRGDGVPELRALSAHERVRQPRVRAQAQEDARR